MQTSAPAVKLYYDGAEVFLEQQVQMQEGIVYGPFREIFSMLGAELSYRARHGRVFASAAWDETLNLQFEAGTDVFYLNDQIASLPAPSFINDGVLFVPLRFVLELGHYRLHWQADGADQVVLHLLSAVSEKEDTPKENEQTYNEPDLPASFAVAASSVPVLMYHHLLPQAEHDGNTGAIVSVEDFEQQIKYLYSNGYYTVGLEDLYLFVQGEKELPRRSVVITFDDGYRSNYDYAVPLLLEYGFRAVQFPITSLIENSYSWLPHMNWEQMEEAAPVFEYHSHSHDLHYYLDDKPVLLVAEAEELRKDFIKSRQLLNCFAFSYPFGVSSQKAVQLLQETGYKMAFTIRGGNVYPGDDPFLLNRRGVYPTTTLADFSELVNQCH